MMNGLRDRIVVQVDGQLKTGRDVVDRRADGRRGVRLRDRAARRLGLRHDARLPSEHLPGRHRDAGSGAAQELHRQAGVRRELLPVHRRGSARVHGAARLPDDGRDDRAGRPAELQAGGRSLEGAGARLLGDPPPARGRPTARCRAACASRITGSSRRSTTSSSRGAPTRSSTGRRCRSTCRSATCNRTVGTMLGYEVTRRYGARRAAGRHDPAALHRVGGPELRRVRAAGHHADARRRLERLRRQGTLGRQADRLSAAAGDVRRRGQHHHRQRRALRRDERRGLHPRPRRRAVRRPQQRRARGRRRRRRSRLRVHDRRTRRRARPRPGGTSPPA